MSNKQAEKQALMKQLEALIVDLSNIIDSYREQMQNKLEDMKSDYDKRLEYLESNPFNEKE